jgi:hypothetical protein
VYRKLQLRVRGLGHQAGLAVQYKLRLKLRLEPRNTGLVDIDWTLVHAGGFEVLTRLINQAAK